MSSRRPNRALRRLVMELASVSADDLAAVVGELDVPQRERVLSLLADYKGEPAPDSLTTGSVAAGDKAFSRLSPWLAARLGAAKGRVAAEFSITPTAVAALKAAALQTAHPRTSKPHTVPHNAPADLALDRWSAP